MGGSKVFYFCNVMVFTKNLLVPVHHEIKFMREQWNELLAFKTVGDLLQKGSQDFIQSIATN